jgi:hypothetical protein
VDVISNRVLSNIYKQGSWRCNSSRVFDGFCLMPKGEKAVVT